MGYFKNLADFSFKTDNEGNILFYPWGTLGRGYILPDKKAEEKIRRFIRWFCVIEFTLLFITVIVPGLWVIGFFILLPIATLVWCVQYNIYIRGLRQTSEKLTLKENFKKLLGK
jgi:hypothetical protein